MKSYSSVIAFLGILTLIFFPLYEYNSSHQDYLDIVTKSFHATQGDFYELYIEAWAQIKKEGISEKELLALSEEILNKWGLSLADCTIDRYADFISVYCSEVLDDNAYFQLSLQSLQWEGAESGTFMGIQVILDDLKNGRKYYQLVNQVFQEQNIRTDVGVTIVGTLAGQLTQEDLQAQADLAFNAVEARVKEGIFTHELLSLSGFTPYCHKYLDVEGKKINLNVALRYHSMDDTTYIHIGAPLIFQEY
ncbi:MAG: hypothetical protein GXW85_02410 [Clostridia bacterium]|nr:hypothetical protein [Clostridia bacterium]